MKDGMLCPSQPFPSIELNLLGRHKLRLPSDIRSELVILDVYCGVHSSQCEQHLKDIVLHLNEFISENIFVILVSMDTREQAERAAILWHLANLPIAYGLEIATARSLGLYVSRISAEGRSHDFAEPGVFFIAPDGTYLGGSTNTLAYLRPTARNLLDCASALVQRA